MHFIFLLIIESHAPNFISLAFITAEICAILTNTLSKIFKICTLFFRIAETYMPNFVSSACKITESLPNIFAQDCINLNLKNMHYLRTICRYLYAKFHISSSSSSRDLRLYNNRKTKILNLSRINQENCNYFEDFYKLSKLLQLKSYKFPILRYTIHKPTYL